MDDTANEIGRSRCSLSPSRGRRRRELMFRQRTPSFNCADWQRTLGPRSHVCPDAMKRHCSAWLSGFQREDVYWVGDATDRRLSSRY